MKHVLQAMYVVAYTVFFRSHVNRTSGGPNLMISLLIIKEFTAQSYVKPTMSDWSLGPLSLGTLSPAQKT